MIDRRRRYKRWSVRAWGDSKIRGLSWPEPNALTIYQYLTLGPEGRIPGRVPAGLSVIAEALRWDEPQPLRKRFHERLDELTGKGLVHYDPEARLFYLPGSIKHDLPANENVLKSWRFHFDELPDSPLKSLWIQEFKQLRERLGEQLQKPLEEQFLQPLRNMLHTPLPVPDPDPKDKTLVEQKPDAAPEWILLLNEIAGTNFRPSTEAHLRVVRGRIADGFTLDDARTVITDRVKRWGGDEKMNEYLRPQTLFEPGNFDGYLQAARNENPAPDDQDVQAVVKEFHALTKKGLPRENAIARIKAGLSPEIWQAFKQEIGLE